jgi:phage terminase small subunit
VSKLTQKQETFVLKYHECGNATEAYRYAYPRSKKWKDKNVWSKASVLLKNGKVLARLQELQKKAEEASQWNVQKLLKAHTRVYKIAIGDRPSPRMVTEGVGDGVTKTIEVEMRDTNITAAEKPLVEIGRLLGEYEKDNKQRGEISLKDFVKERVDGKR